MSNLKHYLLVFDHVKDELVHTEFDLRDVDLATSRYREAEMKYGHSDAIDVVLVASDSLASVRRTHSTYFEGFAVHSRPEQPVQRSETRVDSLSLFVDEMLASYLSRAAENAHRHASN